MKHETMKVKNLCCVFNEQSYESNNKRGDCCQLGIKKKIENLY